MKIGIVDYGAGNLLSVHRAVTHLGPRAIFVNKPEDFKEVSAIILPGVGAFGAAIRSLEGVKDELLNWIYSGKPYLGICLGLQLLFEESEESPGVSGLSVFRGKVVKFKTGKVPQIGWNSVKIVRPTGVFAGIPDGEYFYFLHSFYVVPEDDNLVISRTEYYVDFASGVQKENITAVQFHPEKSGKAGLKFLSNWINFAATL